MNEGQMAGRADEDGPEVRRRVAGVMQAMAGAGSTRELAILCLQRRLLREKARTAGQQSTERRDDGQGD